MISTGDPPTAVSGNTGRSNDISHRCMCTSIASGHGNGNAALSSLALFSTAPRLTTVDCQKSQIGLPKRTNGRQNVGRSPYILKGLVRRLRDRLFMSKAAAIPNRPPVDLDRIARAV